MADEAKEQAAAAELIVTVEASIELPVAETPPPVGAALRFEDVEAAPQQAPPLPTSIKDVIEEAIRNADDEVETALIDALRSTQPR
jgi:hypothetical protein